MPNTYFQFKEFKIEQDKCAMKVCTDSCLFGTWVSPEENVKIILDIGTGTGLLSLMLAQKTTGKIHGIEIDNDAFIQAKENFENSIWKDRLTVYSGDIRTFNFSQQYDFIICNPPFYKNELKSSLNQEKIAKHSLHLNLPDLILTVKKLLIPNGKFALLLPYFRKNEIEKLAAEYHFYPEKILLIKQTPVHDFFRYAAIFSSDKNSTILQEEVVIKDHNNIYSVEAIALLQPYYLYL